MRHRPAFVVLLLLAGCEQLRSGQAGMPREEFVATVIDLRRALKSSESTSAYEAEKARVLARHGTSTAALEEFIRVHGENPSYMSAVWDTIANRLERPMVDSTSAREIARDSARARAAQDTAGKRATPRDSASARATPRH